MSELSSIDIFNALNGDLITTKQFINVFAHDQLPKRKIRKKKWVLVCNASRSGSRGTHWFVLFKENANIELFDSLGLSPEIYNLESFLKNQNVNHCNYNSMRLQSSGPKVCGHYCIFYAYWRCMGYSLENILQRFSEHNYFVNDSSVLDFYINKFN